MAIDLKLRGQNKDSKINLRSKETVAV